MSKHIAIRAQRIIDNARNRITLPAIQSVTPATATVGCVLTAYKRMHNLAAQLAAVRAQTVKPTAIALWHNDGGTPINPQLLANLTYVKAAPNMGVWPRFLLGMELNTDYVCIFDDDTIPGSRWLENCFTTIKMHRGVLGTVGVIFKHETRQGMYKGDSWIRHGWPNPNQQIIEVDIVGHSWFFERDWLRAYAAEPRCGYSTCGEDYHLSVACQKQLGLKTYVPPHPVADKSLWGSLKGMELGTDSVALYRSDNETAKKAKTHAAYVAAGWRPLCMRGGI